MTSFTLGLTPAEYIDLIAEVAKAKCEENRSVHPEDIAAELLTATEFATEIFVRVATKGR